MGITLLYLPGQEECLLCGRGRGGKKKSRLFLGRNQGGLQTIRGKYHPCSHRIGGKRRRFDQPRREAADAPIGVIAKECNQKKKRQTTKAGKSRSPRRLQSNRANGGRKGGGGGWRAGFFFLGERGKRQKGDFSRSLKPKEEGRVTMEKGISGKVKESRLVPV